MNVSVYEFYECDNPRCRLRFPGYDSFPRIKRCPACRSSIHIVARVENPSEVKPEAPRNYMLKIEVLLDNIRSAWNVGSIFRTSDGIGIRKLYLCGITPTPENPKVGKTALGAETSIDWEKHNNAVELCRMLKSRGYTLWALEDTPEAIPLFRPEITKIDTPHLIILGNEVCGVDPGVLLHCDKVVSIPMLGRKHSYNVAVAFGIAASFLLYCQSVSQGSLNILPNT